MGDGTDPSKPDEPAKEDSREAQPEEKPKKRRRSWRRRFLILFLMLAVVLGIGRLALPSALTWYVNRTIDQSPLYDGMIDDIEVNLYRGAYAIKGIRLNKTTGNVPVPLFAATRMDLAIEWRALLSGEVVGRIVMDEPQLNFVDGEGDGEDQTGAGGPWLQMVEDLFPFKINSCVLRNGSIHFRSAASDPPVDVSMSQLEASIENLTNIHEDLAPLVATVRATALAMDHARFEFQMKLDPASYRPTFQLAVRLLGLDVTKTNDLTRAYGSFDFEDGWFDLVVELDAKEGQLEGYVKPLFRNLRIISRQDLKEDNVIQVFWEALIGGVAELFQNQPRDQFATFIPLRGDLTQPGTNILAVVGNVLRNAFIRAFLPRLQGVAEDVDWIQFGPGSVTDPTAVGTAP